MRFSFSVILVCFFIFSCKIDDKKSDIIKEDYFLAANQSHPTYSTFKSTVASEKARLKKRSALEKSEYFYRLINEDIYKYWNGTTWDFNGTTQQPKNGNIACGYFITNTLTDLGFKISRVKLAQAASSKIINELCKDVKNYAIFEDLEQYLKNQPDQSVFIVGLDFHTGYILKDKTGLYFLHSNYIDRKGVMKESIQTSYALKSSKTFMIGNLTKNQKLLNEWINN